MIEKKTLGYRLAKLYRLQLAAVKEASKSLEILPGHLPILITLLDHETPMIQDVIASHVLIDKSVAARGIDHLEKNGFLRRSVNPENRRQKLVYPTAKAKSIQAELFNSLKRSSENLLSPLSPKEQEMVMELLDRMLQAALNR
jgi:DNA-binding MarR family transcriptional regulator